MQALVVLLFAVLAWISAASIASPILLFFLRRRIARLEAELADQRRHLLRLEQAPKAKDEPPPALPVLPAVSSFSDFPISRLPDFPPPPPTPAPSAQSRLELFMGVRLFAWLGGLAALLGVAFFIKYAFDNELLPPEARVALGFLTGIALIVGGVLLRDRRVPVTSQTLCATGIVILYAATFACRSVYHFEFFGLLPTFSLMILITVAAVLLALRLEAQVVAILGMLGGFLTPVLLSTGVDNPAGLFSYTALLVAGVAAVALYRRWHYLVALAALGAVALQLGWLERFFEPQKMPVAFTVLLVFDLLFLGIAFAARRRDQANPWMSWSSASVCAATLLFCIHFLGTPALREPPSWLFASVLGADLCLLALVWVDRKLAWVQVAAGAAVFLILVLWTARSLQPALLHWALGASLALALLHTAFPLMLSAGRDGGDRVSVLARLAPVLASLLPFLILIMTVTRLTLAGPSEVFALALMLSFLLLGLARSFRDGKLCLVAVVCVFLLEATWNIQNLRPANAVETLAWQLGFYLLFTGQVFAQRAQLGGQLTAWIASAAAGPLQALVVHQLVQRSWPNHYMGALSVAFAVPSLLCLVAVLRRVPADAPRRLAILAWYGGVALLFITAAIPVQFDRQWITLAWALEGAALLWLRQRIHHDGLRWCGIALLLAASSRLIFNPAVLAYHPRAETPLLNWYLYAYALTAAACFLGTRLLRRPDRAATPSSVLPPARSELWFRRFEGVLSALGGVLLFLLLNIEIADFFTESGSALTFRFSGNFARDMSYTIGWALFAFALLVTGLLSHARAPRFAAIGLLSVTLLKLFLHDLARLSQLYRIGALIAVAIVAILASYLYQRFLSTQPKDPSP
jgi:uncharacterized membrane protein